MLKAFMLQAHAVVKPAVPSTRDSIDRQPVTLLARALDRLRNARAMPVSYTGRRSTGGLVAAIRRAANG